MGKRRDNLDAFSYDLPSEEELAASEETLDHEKQASEKQMMPKERFDELNARLAQAEQDRRELIKRLAGGMAPEQGAHGQSSQQSGDDASDPLEDMDPNMANALRGLIQQAGSQLRQELMQQFGPALEAAARNENISQVEKAVPGFKDELMSDVEQEYNALSPEEKELYGSSRVGIEALALRVKNRKLEEASSSRGNQSLGGMGMIPSQSASHESVPGERREIDPWSLSDEDFEKFKQRNAR